MILFILLAPYQQLDDIMPWGLESYYKIIVQLFEVLLGPTMVNGVIDA